MSDPSSPRQNDVMEGAFVETALTAAQVEAAIENDLAVLSQPCLFLGSGGLDTASAPSELRITNA